MLETKTELGQEELAEIGAFFDTLDYASPFQHPLWPEDLLPTQSKRFFVLRNEKGLCFFASVTESCLSNARFIKYATLPRGPWCNDKQLAADMLVEIWNYYKQQKFASLYIQPDCDLQRAEWIYRTLRKKCMALLPAPSSEFKATVLTALNKSEEQIFEAFSQRLKRQVKRAVKYQLRAEVSESPEEYAKFVKVIYKMTDARRIVLYTDAYLQEVFKFITRHKMGYFMAAYTPENVMIGGLVLIRDGRKLHFWIGATDPEYKSLPQSHLTHYEAMKLARKTGCDYYDFGSYKFNATPDEQLYQVNSFKLEFGGRLHFHPRPFIMVTNLVRYRTGKLLLLLKERLRRR